MTISRRSRRMALLIALIVSLVAFLTQIDAVQATFTDMHAATVLLRLETEIMQKTPAGQYYEVLFWKHNDELIEITRKYPEHRVEFSRVTRMFIPEIEALLDGKGDAVYITPEHIKNLKAEFAWFASVGSPTLQEDIERELQRFPLDQFIGMTMSEAQDLVNSSWIPDSVIEKSIVPNSDGQWAYYVYNGVYFEYPSSYSLQISESQENFIYLIPTSGTPENWDPCVVKVRVFNAPPYENNGYTRPWYLPEHILWESQIKNIEFPGFNFAGIIPDYPVSHIHSFQYNEANQLVVQMSVFVYETNEAFHSLDDSAAINQKYEYFYHIVDSLQIQKP
jgi:hypothetical protein